MFTIENLRKKFVAPGNVVVNAVDGISLAAETGKLITLLGPSGCGKTTTLRCLAGLERPEAGRIVIANEVVCDTDKGIFVSPSERGIGMVFQSYAIWPHMTVFENVAFPLRVARDHKYSSAEVKDKVERALEMVRMSGYESRPATQLSGGQQQRLAFARGLVREPKILLLDEPLSNLDAKLREQMRVELKRLQKRLGITTVYVTHDQSEALALSDEIAVFNAGQDHPARDAAGHLSQADEPVRRRLHRLGQLPRRHRQGGRRDRGNRAGRDPPRGHAVHFRPCRRARTIGAGERAPRGPRPL